MRCPNCNAECPEQAVLCEFCGHTWRGGLESSPPVSVAEPPPLPSGLDSDNPYAASDSAYTGSPQIPTHEVPNHLALSIISAVMSLLCCCIPFGIVPVFFSTQVNTKYANGDYDGARSASANAKLWSWVCIGMALLMFVLNVILQIVASAGESF